MAVSILVIIVFVAAISRYDVIVSEEIHNVTLSEVEEVSEQIQMHLEEAIEESADDLLLLAEFAVNEQITEKGASDFLKSQSQIDEFENVYYINLDGIGTDVDGMKVDFNGNSTFESALQSELKIEAPYISAENGKNIIALAVPMIEEGELIAVLFAESLLDDTYEDIVEIVEGSGYAFLVDENQNMVFNTSNPFEEFAEEENDSVDFYNSSMMTEIKADFREGKAGEVYYQMEGVHQIVVYAPVESTSWGLVVDMNSDAVNDGLSDAVGMIITVSMVVVFLLIIFAIYAGYSKISSLKSIEKSAYYDPLTKLPNLAKIKKDMKSVLKRNTTNRYSVVKIDVENFKAINEMFGFEIGNRVLQAFKTIRETVDEPTLMIARVGIDEFLLFSGNGFLDDMEERTNIYEAHYKELIPELGEYHISFKYGRYHIAKGEMNVDDIVTKVNMAHRIAKDKKGLIIYDYDDSYKRDVLEAAEITSKMKTALENKEFKVYLQPKFSVIDGGIVGAEALVRWIEPNGDIVYPNRFIPLFEKNGFIVELDRYMLEATCVVIKQWIDSGFGHLSVSVNCSRLNLNSPNFVTIISEIVDRYQIPHQYIEIELTESTIIENEEVLEKLFRDLHTSGFKVSIDDFGSGYSSLGLLKNLKVDTLKLDRSFFVDNKDIVRGDLVVDGIIKLAQSLNMYVVAEGIEEESQIRFLKQIGCDAIQGYYFEKPMAVVEFEEKYKGKLPSSLQLPKKAESNNLKPGTRENQRFEMVLNILNAIKIPVTVFNHSFTALKCNLMALELFEIDDFKQWEKEFFNLSPVLQPSGKESHTLILEHIQTVKDIGSTKFTWVHRSMNGEEFPCEITIDKLHFLDDNGEELYVGVIKDLRNQSIDYDSQE